MPAAPAAIDPGPPLRPPLSGPDFAARLGRLGPFEPSPRLAIGVSGGADSTALAILADEWARVRGGNVLALVVDHGLRSSSASEAAATRARLATLGIAAQVLPLADLRPGPALAARARQARLAALTAAAVQAGIVHLLLGHHAADQAETRLMRARAGSGPAGLAAVPALRETADLRILRPLLDVAPARLRALLWARGVSWVEDPSNADPNAGRTHLRAELDDAAGDGPRIAALVVGAANTASARAAEDDAIAAELARRARLSPLGYALLSPGPISPGALSALWQALSGCAYPPPAAAIRRLAAAPASTTLQGVRLLPAGRLGPGWLLVRETPPPPVPAYDGARWDRFRLHAPGLADGCVIAALPAHAARQGLPAVLRRVLPALLNPYGQPIQARFDFQPRQPACGAAWQGSGSFPVQGCLTPLASLC